MELVLVRNNYNSNLRQFWVLGLSDHGCGCWAEGDAGVGGKAGVEAVGEGQSLGRLSDFCKILEYVIKLVSCANYIEFGKLQILLNSTKSS